MFEILQIFAAINFLSELKYCACHSSVNFRHTNYFSNTKDECNHENFTLQNFGKYSTYIFYHKEVGRGVVQCPSSYRGNTEIYTTCTCTCRYYSCYYWLFFFNTSYFYCDKIKMCRNNIMYMYTVYYCTTMRCLNAE